MTNSNVQYLDSTLTENNIGTDSYNPVLSPNTYDEYRLNNLHTNTGYSNHYNSGYDDHYDCGYDNRSSNGYDNHYSEGCNNYSESGCDNYYQYHNNNAKYCNCSVGCYTAHADKNSGCHDHTNSGCSTHSDTGCNTHSNTGCNTHSDSGCNTHSNSGCSTHTNYTDNYNPVISGVISPPANTFNTLISLAWPVATDADNNTIYYELQYAYRQSESDIWENWVMLVNTSANHTSNEYDWDTSKLTAGEYKVQVRAWDKKEFSPAIESEVLTICHYKAPSWATVIDDNAKRLRKADIDELRTELNTAITSANLTAPTWAEGPITANVTKMKVAHITELRTEALKAQQALNGESTYPFSRETLQTNNTGVAGIDLKEIRNILDNIG
ncbi:hypothetical protein IMX26_10555 [Clostridium sp. 'deep sea']|uniref:hypothetical protein n=1 Tax=Clostridium sp. 'deep sea' TaxID=2779445 RepID=UPI0018966339|nr:hypothetical protein [Clostridium sp. 'deep sea']QOR33932.1 hypothetical protein IMX26_10555 [Clostridium sp. 'deep sea']